MSGLGQTRRFRDVRGISGLLKQQTFPDPGSTSHLCQMRISGTSEHKGARTPRSAQPYGLPMGVVPPAKMRAVSGR
jgi:hypothetical protein